MKLSVTQKQCILLYLGYYNGKVDGIWGSLSDEAVKELQGAEGLNQDGVYGDATHAVAVDAVYNGRFKSSVSISDEIEIEPTEWKGGPHFVKSEFKCKCGGKYCNGYPVEPEPGLVALAVKIRDHFGVPVIITSAIRCETHNANVGGVANSRHKYGKAIDFYVTGKTANEVLAFVAALPEVRYAYAIDSDHVHADIA